MSTWWYLECWDHDPSLRSADEVEQHTYGLPAIRELVQSRPTEVAPGLGYFAGHAATFVVQHPKCRLAFVSEYGDTEEIEAGADHG